MNLRNFVIWGVIIVVLIGLYSMMTGGGRSTGAKEITYSQMLQKVDAGEVKSAKVHGAQVLVTDQSNKQFSAITPNNQDDLVKRLEGQKANISVEAPGASPWSAS
jgi:cell division protease FtsH